MAMAAKELNTAEVAFAAIDEVDKLHFVLKVRFIYIYTDTVIKGGYEGAQTG